MANIEDQLCFIDDQRWSDDDSRLFLNQISEKMNASLHDRIADKFADHAWLS